MASKFAVGNSFHDRINSDDEISVIDMLCQNDNICSLKKKSYITDMKKSRFFSVPEVERECEYTVLLNPESELVKGAIVELSCKVELIQTRISNVEGRVKKKGEPLTCSKKKLEIFLLEFLTNELKKTQRRLIDLKRVISPDTPVKEDSNDYMPSYKDFHLIEEDSSDSVDVCNNNEDFTDENLVNEYDRNRKVEQITYRIKEIVQKIRASTENHRYLHVEGEERHQEILNDDTLSYKRYVKIEEDGDLSQPHSYTRTEDSTVSSRVSKSDSPQEAYECLQCHKNLYVCTTTGIILLHMKSLYINVLYAKDLMRLLNAFRNT